jgi:energy-coupling factor transporter ATP-binding protein EcfA2
MTLEVRGLGRRFEDGSWGLRGLDCRFEGRGITLVSGHNGSGKTLLARHLVGLERPDEGQVLLDGRDLASCLPEARRRVGFVFQEPEHQILGLTVAEDVAHSPRLRGLPKARVAGLSAAAIARVGLHGREQELTAWLSGGEKRRLAVASVLAAEPELIILDEPFNDLDWPGVKILLEILIGLAASGIGLVIITHDLEKCLAHADRLVVLKDGGLLADGGARELWPRLPELGLRRPGPLTGSFEGMTWLA